MAYGKKQDPATSGGQGMSRGERKDMIRRVLFEHVHALSRRELADCMKLGKSPYLTGILYEMTDEGYIHWQDMPERNGMTRYYWLSDLGVEFETRRADTEASLSDKTNP